MVPGTPIQPESITTFQDPPPTLGRDQGRDGRDDWRIPPRPIHERPIVGGTIQSHGTTSPLNRKAIDRHQMRDDLPPFSRP